MVETNKDTIDTIDTNNLQIEIDKRISKTSEGQKLFEVFFFKKSELEIKNLLEKDCIPCFVFHTLVQEGFDISEGSFLHSNHNKATKKVKKAIKKAIQELKEEEVGQFKIGLLSLYATGIKDLGFLFNKMEGIKIKYLFYECIFLFLNKLAKNLNIEQKEETELTTRAFKQLYLETILNIDNRIARGKLSFEKLFQLDKTLSQRLQKDVNRAANSLVLLRQETLDVYRKTSCIEKTGELLNNKVNYVRKNFLFTKEMLLRALLSCWKVDAQYLSELDLAENRYEKSTNKGFIALLQMWNREITSEQKKNNDMLIKLFLKKED